MGDWGLVTKLWCEGRGGEWLWVEDQAATTLNPPTHTIIFVTSPQSPICHQYKMEPVNAVYRIDWDRQLRRLTLPYSA